MLRQVWQPGAAFTSLADGSDVGGVGDPVSIYFNTDRAITSFWISLVPSPMVQSLASR